MLVLENCPFLCDLWRFYLVTFIQFFLTKLSSPQPYNFVQIVSYKNVNAFLKGKKITHSSSSQKNHNLFTNSKTPFHYTTFFNGECGGTNSDVKGSTCKHAWSACEGGRGVEVEGNALISLIFLSVKTSSIFAHLSLRCSHIHAYQKNKCN
jgi:hypothetical protein